LSENSSGVEIALASGPPLQADVAILACGHESPKPAALPYVSPWAEPAGGGAPRHATLLILGTGLTMVDTALALEEQDHRGPILALSRRGLLPHTHRRVDVFPIDAGRVPFDRPLSKLLLWLRATAREADSRGQDWRSVVDGLRPHTQALWRAMTPARRERFLEHARPWWDIHRHRMAPRVAERIHDMIARGRLRILAGKLVGATPAGEGARVVLRPRGSSRTTQLDVARIISCTGVRADPERSGNPLIASLFANGLARSDPLRVGIEVAPDCAVINARGRASRRLYAIGPMSQAAFWEIIAVPDIRLQTAELAHRLATRPG